MGDLVDEDGNVSSFQEDDAPTDGKKNKDALKVYVGGLPFDCEKWKVREHFSDCGKIDWLHMPLDAQERHRGIAFISFWQQESVDAALQLNGTYFGNHMLKVNMASEKPTKGSQTDQVRKRKSADCTGAEVGKADKSELSRDNIRKKSQNKAEECKVKTEDEEQSQNGKDQKEPEKITSKDRKLFIGNIPFDCAVETFRKDFSECGEIQQLTMPKGSDGRSKGVAFVTFRTIEGAEEALKYHGTDYGGYKLTVRMASERVEKGKLISMPRAESETMEINPLEVIVKGLAFGTKEDTVRTELSTCGTIKSVRIPLNKKRKSVGFAFVTFEDKKGVKKALKLSGSEIAGRAIQIERMGQTQGNNDSESKADQGKSKKRDVPASEELEDQEVATVKAKRSKKESKVES